MRSVCSSCPLLSHFQSLTQPRLLRLRRAQERLLVSSREQGLQLLGGVGGDGLLGVPDLVGLQQGSLESEPIEEASDVAHAIRLSAAAVAVLSHQLNEGEHVPAIDLLQVVVGGCLLEQPQSVRIRDVRLR